MTVDEVIDRDKLENLFSIKFINNKLAANQLAIRMMRRP